MRIKFYVNLFGQDLNVINDPFCSVKSKVNEICRIFVCSLKCN